MKAAEGITRAELAEGYAHPYRRWIPLGLKLTHSRYAVAVTALALLTVAAHLAFDVSRFAFVVALLLVAGSLLRSAGLTVATVMTIRRRIATWQAEDSELDRVRRRRPHAGEQDVRLAHDEYAVSVGTGELLTWCFMPLDATEGAVGDETLVPGVPCYAAEVVERTLFDARDTARAAEQLVQAQTTAAEWELAAARDAEVAWRAREDARELLSESESTGDALRRLTGQS